MTNDRRSGPNALLANLAMLGGLGVFGLGILLIALYIVGHDRDVRELGVLAIFAGAFIEVAVIARAVVVRATRNLPKRAR